MLAWDLSLLILRKTLRKSSKTYQTIQNQDKQNHAYIVINWQRERQGSSQQLQRSGRQDLKVGVPA